MNAFQHELHGSHIFYMDTVRDLGVVLDSNLYFHQHVYCKLSQPLKLLGLIRALTFPFHLVTIS
jgi:hypothetical protein